MEEILSVLNEIKNELCSMTAEIQEVKTELTSLSAEVESLSATVDEIKGLDNTSLSDVSYRITELAEVIHCMQGNGPDNTLADVCNKLSVIIRCAGYEDDTLGLGTELIDGNGRKLVVTKYDSDGIEVEYLD